MCCRYLFKSFIRDLAIVLELNCSGSRFELWYRIVDGSSYRVGTHFGEVCMTCMSKANSGAPIQGKATNEAAVPTWT